MTTRYGTLDDPSAETDEVTPTTTETESTVGPSTGCVMWPVRFTATSYVLRVTADGSTEDLPFPAAGSLTLLRNYWNAGDGQEDADGGVGGYGDLFEMLEECLEGHSKYGTTWSVARGAYGTDSWAMTIFAEGAFSLLWNHENTTLDAEVFGFLNTADATSTSTTGGAYIASVDHPKGLWRPGRPAWTDEGEYTPVIGGITRGISGVSRVSRVGLGKAERDLSWKYIVDARARIESATATGPYDSFEYMWLYAASLGYPIRWYPDETAMTATDYTLYSVRDLTWRLASMSDPVYWWEVMLPLQKETA
jgi:hypothetical protein